jgi:Fe-S-cluster containining protein
MGKAPFYAEGLRFSCKRCSSCCRYDSGFVFVSENDLEKLVLALKIDRDSFVKTYCRWVPDWRGNEVISLREKSNKDCVLWDNGCAVYEHRPLQCKTFPFWESILSSSGAWEIAASSCPGINSGVLHSKGEIEKWLEKRANQPAINRAGGNE